MKLFIVEDSPMMKVRLKQMLEQIDVVEIVGEADKQNDAISQILNLKPDVVVLDIRLKEGNGLEVLKFIKRELPSTLVIMLTNYPYIQYRDTSYSMGADYFFYKATEFTKVFEVVSSIDQNSRNNIK